MAETPVPPSAERPLAELLGALAEDSPAPGAGCATAWAGALAAALLQMTAAFADVEASVSRARALGADLLESGERELTSYRPVLEALRMDRNDPSRARRLNEALSDASEAPLAIARASAEVAERAAEVVARSKRAVAGDAIAGVLLAEAATQAAAELVEINLGRRPGDARLDEVAELRSRAARARERVRRG